MMDLDLNFDIVKSDMMRLWKDTFHDSDRYIRLLFDNYFEPGNVCVRYENERLVASLLGVEYRFCIDGREVAGLYLCGLATVPDHRRRGIMGEMMEEIERRAFQKGMDFTFLIPADDHLRRYYRRRGYSDCSVVARDRVVIPSRSSVGDVRKFERRVVGEIPEEYRKNMIRQLARWCEHEEKIKCGNHILHSMRDFEIAILENENAFFLTDGEYDLKYPNLVKIKNVVFPDAKDGIPLSSDGDADSRCGNIKMMDGRGDPHLYGMVKMAPGRMPVVSFAMSLLLD